MILQSPLSSAIRTQCPGCCASGPLQSCDIFINRDKLGGVQYPTLISACHAVDITDRFSESVVFSVACTAVAAADEVHGTQDHVVPPSHGRELHALLAQPAVPVWAAGAGHNNIEYMQERAYYDGLRAFVAGLQPPDISEQCSAAVLPGAPDCLVGEDDSGDLAAYVSKGSRTDNRLTLPRP